MKVNFCKNEAAGNFTLAIEPDPNVKWKFVQAFLDEMKDLVPWTAREWSEPDKQWVIDIKYYADVYKLYETHFVPKNQTRLEL